jgi:divinyl chlorophyllide a 8-vinyl-reductase
VLEAAKTCGVLEFVLLSAICVQKPLLAFQHAKLAFEDALKTSGLTYSIVRPTAYFKSLAGQIARVKAGKPFVMFGNGELTACKPISDRDLARFIVGCLDNPLRQNKVLPIGGPGPALTPRAQGELLFRLMGQTPKFKSVPIALMDTIIGGLSLAGRVSQRAADKAEFARIGRYYATESMLVWDSVRSQYNANATPETGRETLEDFYRAVLKGEITVDRGAHAVF